MEPVAPHPAGNQTLSERTRDRHDGVKTPKREALRTLVESVSESPASESMHGRDRRDSKASRDTPIHHVRTVSVRVDNGREISATYAGDKRALAQVRASWNGKRNDLDTGVLEGAQVGLVRVGMLVQNRRDANCMSALAMSDSEEAYNALPSTRRSGLYHVKNRKPIQHEPEES